MSPLPNPTSPSRTRGRPQAPRRWWPFAVRANPESPHPARGRPQAPDSGFCFQTVLYCFLTVLYFQRFVWFRTDFLVSKLSLWFQPGFLVFLPRGPGPGIPHAGRGGDPSTLWSPALSRPYHRLIKATLIDRQAQWSLITWHGYDVQPPCSNYRTELAGVFWSRL